MVVPPSDPSNDKYLIVEADFDQSIYTYHNLPTSLQPPFMVPSITPDNTTANDIKYIFSDKRNIKLSGTQGILLALHQRSGHVGISYSSVQKYLLF